MTILSLPRALVCEISHHHRAGIWQKEALQRPNLVLPLPSTTPEILPMAWCTLFSPGGREKRLPEVECFSVPFIFNTQKEIIQYLFYRAKRDALS